MEDAWEEAFYGGSRNDDGSQLDTTTTGVATCTTSMSNNSNNEASATTNNDTTSTPYTTNDAKSSSRGLEREIQWHDYWMPPKPSPSKYQVPLPFDTAVSASNNTVDANNNSAWSTSFNMGYNPGSGGGAMSGIGGSDSAGITHSWREHVLSESLRKVLEGCDVVKGFNIIVDGGGNNCGFANKDSANNHSGTTNKHAKQLSSIINAGGGFHAGLATSLLEELSEECRSAGRWVVMVDPLSNNGSNDNGNGTEGNRVHHFRRCLNAGLALHGLSTNADAFLPVSIDGAYQALRGGKSGNGGTNDQSSPNRQLFEGSAALSLALETSTLFYRLHHRRQPSSSHSNHSRRSRIGIQSGFYQGYSGNTGFDDDNNEPYASAPSLTYHEFLACARPSSDRRRSILELDALLRPISYPSSATAGGGVGSIAGGGALSASVLASLTSAGLVGSSGDSLGELQKRLMRGTSIERKRMEQQQQQQRRQYRSSRGGSSSRKSEPGEWLEDISTNALGGGGLLSSLSGNSIPFGRRADHHHFALSTSLRPAASDARSFTAGDNSSSAFLRPMMESMGVGYRPEVSLGAVVKDTVVDLTGVGSYWRSVFTDRSVSKSTPVAAGGGSSGNHLPLQQQKQNLSPKDVASHTPILSVLGNSTRSYPRLHSISSGFIDALNSRSNMGYLSRDVMAGIIPEKDDCEEALEHCQELVDVYEPAMGSGLVLGEDANDGVDAYFDEDED